LGLAFHNDQSSGIFQTQEAAVSYAVHIRMSRFQTLSLGAKGLFQTRSISMDGFYTGSQYVPDRGFNTSISNGENMSELRTSFRTFSTGLHWQEVDKKGRVLNQFGFSIFDINKPKDSFLGNQSTLSSTIVINGGVEAYSSGAVHIFPEALLTYSAAKAMLNTGARIQKELNPKAKTLSDRVELLAKYAIGRSGIIGIQLHRENFSIGASYDFPFLRSNAGNLGALEVALEWRKLVSTRAQKLIAKRKKEADERKKLQAQKVKPLPKQKELMKDSTAQQVVELAKLPPDTIKSIPPMEIVTAGTAPAIAETSAKAGPLKQEPLLIEKVTLHFPFEFNSADLDEETEVFLENLTNTLLESEHLKVRIVGHTDNIGSDKFNLHLSHKRAEAVKRKLIKMGISADRMITDGKGKNEPLNKNETEEDRARNRRVEILIYY
jgi:type IX secretion system PorP/SprF family membrane protein